MSDLPQNVSSFCLETIKGALTVVGDEKGRIEMFMPFLDFLTNPIRTTEERRHLVCRLPPLAQDYVYQYCQAVILLQGALMSMPRASKCEIHQAEQRRFALQKCLVALGRREE